MKTRQTLTLAAALAAGVAAHGAATEPFAFELNTLDPNAVFAIDTLATSGVFSVETTAVETNGTANVRVVRAAGDILAITCWGAGTVTASQGGGEPTTLRTFDADQTFTWVPSSATGTWTLTHSGATPGAAAGATATFVFEASAALAGLDVKGFSRGADGGWEIAFAPDFGDEGGDVAAWLASDGSRVRIRAATELRKLDTDEAARILLSELGPAVDAAAGTVTLALTLEKMKTVAEDAPQMFFKLEVAEE